MSKAPYELTARRGPRRVEASTAPGHRAAPHLRLLPPIEAIDGAAAIEADQQDANDAFGFSEWQTV